MDTKDLLATADSRTWAKEFMRIQETNNTPIDVSLMEVWFANAIMTGWDIGRKRLSEEIANKENV